MDIENLRRVLRESRTAVLAMASGGCGRYIFSSDVAYRIDADGWPVLTYDSPNPFHHQLLVNSGMHLIIDLHKNADGSDHSRLVLAGRIVRLRPEASPGQVETGADGHNRQYRFETDHAFVSLESGESQAVDVTTLVTA